MFCFAFSRAICRRHSFSTWHTHTRAHTYVYTNTVSVSPVFFRCPFRVYVHLAPRHVLRAHTHTHTQSRANVTRGARARTHAHYYTRRYRTRRNNRSVRFSAGCSSDEKKNDDDDGGGSSSNSIRACPVVRLLRCKDDRHVDMNRNVRRPTAEAALALGLLESAPSSWTAAMDRSAAADHTSNELTRYETSLRFSQLLGSLLVNVVVVVIIWFSFSTTTASFTFVRTLPLSLRNIDQTTRCTR